MDCDSARPQLIDLARGRLPPAPGDEVRRHLQGCPACRGALEAEAALDELLGRTVPRRPAPPALRQRLEGLATTSSSPALSPGRPGSRWRRRVVPVLASGLAVALVTLLAGRELDSSARAEVQLTDELVNDHLRLLASQRPAEIESGGPHQVKPWFEGRLDFAPLVPSPPGGEPRLRGGAVGYVLDRRAALLQYTLRLHRLTLLVVRAEGLPWPPGLPRVTGTRGFQVVRWRSGELGYALVSDVSAEELAVLGASFQVLTGR
jgi:anti-sigma factor RsiW